MGHCDSLGAYTEANQAIHRVRPNILSLMFLHVAMDVTDAYLKGFCPILVFLPSRAIQRLGLPPKTAKKGQMANFGCHFLGILFTITHPNTASKAVILPQNWDHVLQKNGYLCRFLSFIPKNKQFEASKQLGSSIAFYSLLNLKNRTNGSEVSPNSIIMASRTWLWGRMTL